jgi:hypothetical protein
MVNTLQVVQAHAMQGKQGKPTGACTPRTTCGQDEHSTAQGSTGQDGG